MGNKPVQNVGGLSDNRWYIGNDGVAHKGRWYKAQQAAVDRTNALKAQRQQQQTARVQSLQTQDPTQSMRYMRDLASQQMAYEKAHNLPVTQQDFTVGNRQGVQPGTDPSKVRIINGQAYGPGQRPQFLNQLKPTAIPNIPQAPGAYVPNSDFLNGTGNLTNEDVAGLAGEYSSRNRAPAYLQLSPSATNAQQRSQIASLALSSNDPRYRDPETLGYYRRLALEASPDSSGAIPLSDIERQYLSQGYGANIPEAPGGTIDKNTYASSVERLYRGLPATGAQQ